ncbi:MAG: hypothetical protein AAF667_04495 [Pseudomonadota bacterium]
MGRKSGRIAAFAVGLLAGLPGIAGANTLTVTASDLLPFGTGSYWAPGVAPPPYEGPSIKVRDRDPVSGWLAERISDGRAHGFADMVYDNRDRLHSSLLPTDFPALPHLKYGPELVQAGIDYGIGGRVLLPTVTFGNSSTAITGGNAPRSLPRFAMTDPEWPDRLFTGYRRNHIYIYPEHRDHDLIDLFPANWPYTVISQGSSGSDQAFMKGFAMSLAALPPETFAKLREERLVAPTLQMLLRQSMGPGYTGTSYLSGPAHPVVFDGKALDRRAMVRAAAELKADEIPPMVQLTVLDESFSETAGLANQDERLFSTPSAIARLWHSPMPRAWLELSAETTRDPNGRALEFHWRLLNGDPAFVQIEPMGEEAHKARITIDWHAPLMRLAPIDQGAVRMSSRVDVGVIAWNGVNFSAPAIVSVDLPAHQKRTYEHGPDGALTFAQIDYDAVGRRMAFDPLLYWTAPWSDRFVDGRWQRRFHGTAEWRDSNPDFVHPIDRSDPKRPVLQLWRP